ncbi:MAG: amidohydrolase [Saprospiraceae bacterium]|nr:amidohydrolase [Saprospiraceae bacterium]
MKQYYFIILLIPFINTLFAQSNIQKLVEADYSYLEKLYLHLHQNPELSFYETNTAKRMADELRSLGFEVSEQIGGNGVVGVLKNGEGPTVMVRTDMDALPIIEETGLPYASKVKTKDEIGNEVGVMHACGHDTHMTSWVAAARNLSKMKNQWKGTLVFIGQPAEERNGGAKAMLDAGLFQKFPKPDYVLALHAAPNVPAGKIGVKSEYSFAFTDFMDITVYGRGGHGAYPHTTIDPVVLSAKIIMALQTVVSREISPLEPAVVTVGSIHGGAKGNVIPNEVRLELTMRCYNDEVRDQIIEKIKRICVGEAMAAGVPEDMMPKMNLKNEFCPSVYNDPILTNRLKSAFQKTLGVENVLEVPPTMAGEDFSYFGRTEEKIPTCIFWLGAIDPQLLAKAEKGEAPMPSLHNSKFAPVPEPTLKTGAIAMTAAVLDLLSK